MQSHGLPLTRARGMAALPRHVEDACGWGVLAHLFERRDLPVTLLTCPDMLMPLKSMQDLFEDAALTVGDRCFGCRVGQAMTFSDYGIWGRYLASAQTLGSAIRRAEKTIWIHQSGALMGAATSGAHTLLLYARPPVRAREIARQHADHVIWPMITLVREYLGPEWLPDWVELDYPRDPEAAKLEDRIGCPILFSKPSVAIAIPTEQIQTPVGMKATLGSRVSLVELRAQYGTDSARRFIPRVEAIISLRLLEGQTDVYGAARMLGMSSRSLQRLLQEEGISYRRLVERCRLRRAADLLKTTTEPITSIALSLGYEEPGNFARAFRRLTGQSPNQFRSNEAAAALSLSHISGRSPANLEPVPRP